MCTHVNMWKYVENGCGGGQYERASCMHDTNIAYFLLKFFADALVFCGRSVFLASQFPIFNMSPQVMSHIATKKHHQILNTIKCGKCDTEDSFSLRNRD